MIYSNTHHIQTVWICSIHEKTTPKLLLARQIDIRNTEAHKHYTHIIYIPASFVQKASHVPGVRKDEQQGRPDIKVRCDLHGYFISFHVFLYTGRSELARARSLNQTDVCFWECCKRTCKRWTTTHTRTRSHTWVTLLRGCAIDHNLIKLMWSADHWRKWGGTSPVMLNQCLGEQ